MRAASFSFLVSLLGAAWLPAAPPTLDALLPSGGRSGESDLPLTAFGKLGSWPPRVWCSQAGVRFLAGDKEGEFKVSIGQEVEPGPCWVRIYNEEGCSEPRLFVVSHLREICETRESQNDAPADGLDVGSLPVVINGRLEKSGDVDSWKVSLKKGQTLHARLDGYALRSGIDPFLHLYDPEGVRIALASDHSRNLDPRLNHPIEQDGDYVISVMAIASPPNANVTFHGSAGAAWRLLLATDSRAEAESGVRDGEPAAEDTLPGTGESPLDVPIEGFGTLEDRGEGRAIVFSGKKGQLLELSAGAIDYGFPTDPVLVLENLDGKVIRETDDTKADQDASYLFRVPADGNYQVRVLDRFGRAGSAFRYFLEIKEAKKDWEARMEPSFLTIKAGEKKTLKLKIERQQGHEGVLDVKVDGLPQSMELEGVAIDAKASDVELAISAREDAAQFSGPIRIRVSDGEEEKPARFSFQGSDARGPYLLDEIDTLWLTVLPKGADGDKKG